MSDTFAPVTIREAADGDVARLGPQSLGRLLVGAGGAAESRVLPLLTLGRAALLPAGCLHP